jgi:hypothetical protein
LVLQPKYSYPNYRIAHSAVCIAASGSNKTTTKNIVEAAAKGCAQVLEVVYADTARSHGVLFSEKTKMMRFAGEITTLVCTGCCYLLSVPIDQFAPVVFFAPVVMLVLFLQLRPVFACYIPACTPRFSIFILPNLELLVCLMRSHDVPFSHSTSASFLYSSFLCSYRDAYSSCPFLRSIEFLQQANGENVQENPKAALQVALSSAGHVLFLCSDAYHVLLDMAEKKRMMGKYSGDVAVCGA